MNPIYVKYNPLRKKRFELKTVVYSNENNERLVYKYSIDNQSEDFLKHILDVTKLFSEQYKDVFKVEPVKLEENALISPWISGESFQEILLSFLEKEKREEYLKSILEYRDLLYGSGKIEVSKIKRTSREFQKIFGNLSLDQYNLECIPISNIDLSFENIILNTLGAPKWSVFDCEWTFSFPIPVEYILYRNIGMFYAKYGKSITTSKLVPFEEVMDLLKISNEKQSLFSKMEDNFQKYVHGDNASILENYLKPILPWTIDSTVAKIYWPTETNDFFEEYKSEFVLSHNENSTSSEKELINIVIPSNEVKGKTLRIDLTDYPCCFQIERIYLTDGSEKNIVGLDITWNNADFYSQEYMVFLHDDPQLLVDLPELDGSLIYSLCILVCWRPLYEVLKNKETDLLNANNSLEQVISEKKYLLSENGKLSSSIETLTKEISEKSQDYREKEQECKEKDRQLETIYNSKIWKFSTFFKKSQ